MTGDLSRRTLLGGIALASIIPLAGCASSRPIPSRPMSGGDWPQGNPADFGLDPAKLDMAATRLAAEGERQGLAIIRDGRLIFERYWANDYHRAEPTWRNVSFSAGKSWGATMIGRAVTQGHLSVDDLAAKYVAAERTGLHPHTTIRHLLTMSSGGSLVTKPSSKPPRRLDDMSPPRPADEYRRAAGHSEERGAPAGYGVSIAPGSMFFYDGAAADHLAEIVSSATGVPSYDYMMRAVLAPLGCRDTDYQPEGIDSNRDIRIGGSMLISCRDLARLGQLYLDDGRLNGKQFIDANYIREAILPSERNSSYGFLWLLNREGRVANAPRSMYFAAGARGQYCFVLPEQGLVVATMGFGKATLEAAEAWESLGPALVV